MVTPLTAALCCSVCWGTAWFFSARVSRQVGSLNGLFLFQLLGVPLLLVAFPFRPALEAPPQWGAFLGLAALCCGCMGLFFHAMRVGNLALVTPLTQTAPVVTALLGMILLKETASPTQMAGMVVVLLGIVLLSVARGQGSKRVLAGVPHAMGAAGAAGFYLFLCAMVARVSGWYWTSLGIRLGMVILLGVIVLPRRHRWLKGLPAGFWRDAALAATLDVTAFALYNFTVSRAQLWYVAAVVSSQSLITVVLAGLFLRERLSARQWLGLALVLLGLLGLQSAAVTLVP